jgi:hypothetical protein
MSQGGLQLRVFELKSCGSKGLRFYPCACQEHFVGHLAEGQSRGERGHWENRAPVKDAGERLLAKMLMPFRCGLGGIIGSGRQYMIERRLRLCAKVGAGNLTCEPRF